MNESGGGRLLTIPQAAQQLGVSRPTAYRMVSAGQMPGLVALLGRQLRVKSEALMVWLEGSRE